MYERFVSTLRRTFPSSASAFSSSLARVLIERLRLFYLCSLSLDLPRSLNECHRDFETGLKVLDALGGMKFSTKPPFPEPIPVAIDGIAFKQSQRKNKLAKRDVSQNTLVDSAPFAAIGMNVPDTKERADDLTLRILTKQERLLEVRLPFHLY